MLRLPPSTSSSELKLPKGVMVTVAPLNSSTPPLLPPGCRLSKLPAANSTLFPVPSTFHDPKSIWVLGTRLRPLPPLSVTVLVATPFPPLTSTVPPLNRPACHSTCPARDTSIFPELVFTNTAGARQQSDRKLLPLVWTVKTFELLMTSVCWPPLPGLSTRRLPPNQVLAPVRLTVNGTAKSISFADPMFAVPEY